MGAVTIGRPKKGAVAALLVSKTTEDALPGAPSYAAARDITGEALDYSGPQPPEPLDRVRWALRFISADCTYEVWLRVCFAVAEALQDDETATALLVEWSVTVPNRYKPGSVEQVLRSDRRRGDSITRRTLFFMARAGGMTSGPPIKAERPMTGEVANDATPVHVTDRTVAAVFVRWCGDRFRYDHSTGRYLPVRRGAWRACRKGEAQEEFLRVSAQLLAEAARAQAAGATDRAKTLVALAKRAEDASGIAAALKLASSAPKIAACADEFDRDPDLLNVGNGVIHLPTGELRGHDPALMLSRQCPVVFDPDAACPQWLEFLASVTLSDDDLIDYLQRMCGYMLSGHVSAEKMFFMLGYGANGKSVFANVVRHILGGYAVVVPSGFLMLSRRDGGSATPELAMIAGARVVLANEVEAGTVLSGQMVKVAVSTEHITARPLYGPPFTFSPTHKLWVRGNHKPIVRDNDEGIWRRIALILFERNFAPHERDEGLEARLRDEAPGILAWMVRGFIKWRAEGLRPARRVEAASRAYRQESDLLQQWLTDRCAVGPNLIALQRTAYANYQTWCVEQGMRHITKKSFTAGLTERGFSERREGGGERRMLYVGFEISR